MSYFKRIDKAFQKSLILPLSPNTKYVIFSDCHRGVGDHTDDFLNNSNSYSAALSYYFKNGYHYIEAGDGDELWENKSMCQIREIHGDIFQQLKCFRYSKRLSLLYGNHDISKKYSVDSDFSYEESIILQSKSPNMEFRILHGHQIDLINSNFWRLSAFLIRHLWSPLESLGIKVPIGAAKNNRKKNRLERKYISYARKRNCYLLTGHTHNPSLCTVLTPYCNCGSCVHPGGITCIELTGYQIRLVKWCIRTQKDGAINVGSAKCPPLYPLYVTREILHSDTLSELPQITSS